VSYKQNRIIFFSWYNTVIYVKSYDIPLSTSIIDNRIFGYDLLIVFHGLWIELTYCDLSIELIEYISLTQLACPITSISFISWAKNVFQTRKSRRGEGLEFAFSFGGWIPLFIWVTPPIHSYATFLLN
jgi:hypothetical protein